MIQYSIVTEQPDSEPVTLDEAKDHLEYTGTLKDNYINSLVKTARRLCEAYTGLSFVTQEREVKLDFRFPCSLYIDIPYGPVQSILEFSYLNTDGGATTLVQGVDFEVDAVRRGRPARVYPIDSNGAITSWPANVLCRPEAITINYQAGYDNVSGEILPEQAKQGIYRLIAKMFEKRGDESGKDGIIDWDTQTLLDTIKVTWNANYD